MRLHFGLLTIVAGLGGCSTFDTYLLRPTSYMHLPKEVRKNEAPVVATLSLDASRRLMITQLSNPTFTCSEPPPDAATSLLAQEAIQAAVKHQSGASLNGSYNSLFEANATVMAQRTAAVEFWRTTSFSYCQLLMNGRYKEANDYLYAAMTIAPHLITPTSNGVVQLPPPIPFAFPPLVPQQPPAAVPDSSAKQRPASPDAQAPPKDPSTTHKIAPKRPARR